VLDYAARLVSATSPDSSEASPLVKRAVRYGAGVRGAQALVLAAKAVALLEGRGHVAFADLQRTALPVLRHRVLRSFEGEAEGISTDRVIGELVESVAARPEAVERAVREA
jgi:MoxR-like ATPase